MKERIRLGESIDLAHHPVTGYLNDKTLELEYQVDGKTFTTSEEISKILSNIDDYMFTPYAEFVYEAKFVLDQNN